MTGRLTGSCFASLRLGADRTWTGLAATGLAACRPATACLATGWARAGGVPRPVGRPWPEFGRPEPGRPRPDWPGCDDPELEWWPLRSLSLTPLTLIPLILTLLTLTLLTLTLLTLTLRLSQYWSTGRRLAGGATWVLISPPVRSIGPTRPVRTRLARSRAQ